MVEVVDAVLPVEGRRLRLFGPEPGMGRGMLLAPWGRGMWEDIPSARLPKRNHS